MLSFLNIPSASNKTIEQVLERASYGVSCKIIAHYICSLHSTLVNKPTDKQMCITLCNELMPITNGSSEACTFPSGQTLILYRCNQSCFYIFISNEIMYIFCLICFNKYPHLVRKAGVVLTTQSIQNFYGNCTY